MQIKSLLPFFALLLLATTATAAIPPYFTVTNVTFEGKPLNEAYYVASLQCTNWEHETYSFDDYPKKMAEISITDQERNCTWRTISGDGIRICNEECYSIRLGFPEGRVAISTDGKVVFVSQPFNYPYESGKMTDINVDLHKDGTVGISIKKDGVYLPRDEIRTGIKAYAVAIVIAIFILASFIYFIRKFSKK